MKPNLEDTQVFLMVVDARSFTVAAERLAKTKSAVSQTVTRLERDLGAQLLYRSTRALALTEAGSEFYSHCCDIRDSYGKALASIKQYSVKPSGLLTITAPHTLSETLIVPAMTELLKIHPNIDIRLLANDAPMDLIDAQIDLAIRVGPLEVQTAKVSKLGMLYESLYVSPYYIKVMGGIPEDMHSLGRWQHIASDWQGQPIKYNLAGGVTFKVKPRFRCNSVHDIIALTLQGQGIARLPDIIVASHVKQGTLVKLEFVAASPVHTMHLFSKRPPEKVQSFVKILKRQLQQHDTWHR